MTTALEITKVSKIYGKGDNAVKAVDQVSLDVKAGEFIALVGPSGAGKSTLLHIAGLLEKPDSGAISIAGDVCADMDDDSRTLVRRHHVGFVYQYHHLLPEFTAMENIAIPQIISGISRKEARKRSNEMLDWLGLTDRSTHRPARLSGGEQQRVAIGRALANAPKLLLADEPTGNLDPHTAGEVFDVLIRLARGAGLAALIATHNPELASRMDRIVTLEDGHLI